MKHLALLAAALVAAATIGWMTTASSSHDAVRASFDDERVTLTFGVYRTDKATTMYRTFRPVVEALQESLTARLGRPVDIELQIYKTYEEGLDSLVKGEADFVRFGPASYVLAKEREPDVSILAMEHKGGKKRFKGVIAVRKTDRAKTLKDLRGRKFAFGDPNSTIGRYLSQAELVRAGIRAGDLAAHEFLGRHDAVAMGVMLGDFDAGAVKSSTFDKMNKSGKLRKLHTFDNVTKPWLARAGLDAKIHAALRASLLGINKKNNARACGPLKVSGWLPSTDKDYALAREGMKIAVKEFDGSKAKR